MRPDFVVIGGMKCGSTSLWKYLSMHPEISLPEKRKNLEFFDTRDNWDKGIAWYESFFHAKNDMHKVFGEVSTEYSKYPLSSDVAKNMYSVIPNAKILYIVRDPIERIKSQYIHSIGNATESRDFELAVCDAPNHYINFSCYFYQIEQYLAYYRKENIHIIISEELRNNPEKTLKNIFSFIGVDNSFTINQIITINTSSERRKWNHIGRIIRKSKKYFGYYNYYKYKYPKLYFLLENSLSTPVKKPIVTQEVRRCLLKQISPDIIKLQNLFSLDLSHWNIKA